MSRSYPPGVPCWIDTAQSDPERARHFYAKLMQWAGETIGDDYLVAALDELPVAGIAASGADGGHARWTTFIAVDDLDAAIARVTEHHGTVQDGPSAIGDRARVARCQDPAGAHFGLWQAGDMPGAGVVGVPGAWSVSDLHCDDERAVQQFYGDVFGWKTGTVDVGAGQWATMLCVPGFGRNRALEQSGQVKEGDAEDAREGKHDDSDEIADAIGWLAPVEQTDDGPDWRVTFTVADRDDAATAAQRLGAQIISELDTRWSRTALVRDPQGALLTLSQALPGN